MTDVRPEPFDLQGSMNVEGNRPTETMRVSPCDKQQGGASRRRSVLCLRQSEHSIERRTIHDSRSIHAGEAMCSAIGNALPGESIFEGTGIT